MSASHMSIVLLLTVVVVVVEPDKMVDVPVPPFSVVVDVIVGLKKVASHSTGVKPGDVCTFHQPAPRHLGHSQEQ